VVLLSDKPMGTGMRLKGVTMTSASALVNSAGTFPIPRIIPFTQLGFQGATAAEAREMFIGVGRYKELPGRYRFEPDRGRPNVHPVVAFEAARRMRFGLKAESKEWRQIWSTLQSEYFPGINFFGKQGRVQPIEVRLRETKPFPDGDTARVEWFKVGEEWLNIPTRLLLDGDWIEFSSSVRMDGVDSAESWERSGKFDRHRTGVATYLQKRFDVPEGEREALTALAAARIVYLGKVAGAVTYAFGEHFEDKGIRLAPAYALQPLAEKANDDTMDDTLDLWDKYGRIIGRILAGRENDGEDLLAGFTEFVLPTAMKMATKKHLTAYRNRIAPHAEVLARWKNDPERKELYEALGPISPWHTPSRIYSTPVCRKLARVWTKFLEGHPEARNDIQTMSALIGTAPPYAKYPGHMLGTDLAAEWIALGAVRSISKGHGLTGDLVYQLLRSSVNPLDPYRSLAYSDPEIGLIMADLKDSDGFDPSGLHDEFLKENVG